MLRDYVQKTQDEISRLRVADYLRTSRDRVLNSGLVHFWFKKWVVAALAAIAVLLVGVALLISSGIDFDTFLNYFALGLLIFVLITLFYGIIAIHDVPYELAKHRNHPHQDAIHAAGWSACSRCMRFGRSCGSGRCSTARTVAGACSRRPKRATDTPRSNPTP